MKIKSKLLRNSKTEAYRAPYGQICRFVDGPLRGKHVAHGGAALVVLETGEIFIPEPMQGAPYVGDEIYNSHISVCEIVTTECEFSSFECSNEKPA